MVPSPSKANRHPRKAFLVLFTIEIWERFGYHGMSALLVLYMVERLGFADARADLTWGTFSALIYSMPLLGGYIGDRVLGAKRTLVMGGTALGLGYVLLAIPLRAMLFPAMGLIGLGTGLFKINPNNLLSRLYEGDHSKLDVLFTLYYTSLQIGAFVSILLTPWIASHSTWVVLIGTLRFDSWHLAFGISALGMILGLLSYAACRQYVSPYGTAPDFRKLDWAKFGAVIGVSLLIAFLVSVIIRYHQVAIELVGLFLALMIYVFAHLCLTSKPHERSRIVVCIILTVISSIWAVYNQQIYTSLTLFALRNVEHSILGLDVKPAQFQDLNQFWLTVFALPLAWFYQRMNKTRRGDFSIAAKYACGLYLLALAFLLYAASTLTAQAGVVSSWWLIGGYAAQSFGELLISAIGFSMVSQLVPERSRGIIMGAWFLGMGVGLYAGGYVASLASPPVGVISARASLSLYARVFLWLGLSALACGVVATAIIPFMNRLSQRR